MLTHHSAFNGIQRIDFQPDTFTPRDLLWLPHHAKLAQAGRKRQAEHLAGRIAAVHALQAYGEKAVPDIGDNRQPLWPAGLYGSISHCEQTAVAVVDSAPVGIDIETVFSPTLADELAGMVASEAELTVLRACSLSFPLALTLAFSAKESLYKAFSDPLHFHDAVVCDLDNQHIIVRLPALPQPLSLRWYAVEPQRIITLFTT